MLYAESHEWTDAPTGARLRVDLANLANLLQSPAATREILRLAQRVQDLEAEAAKPRALPWSTDLLQRIADLEAQLAAEVKAHRALADKAARVDALQSEVNHLEAELLSLNATALVRRVEGLEAGVRNAVTDKEAAQSRADAFQRALKAAEAQLTERENALALAKAALTSETERANRWKTDAMLRTTAGMREAEEWKRKHGNLATELGERVVRNAQLRRDLEAAESRGRQYCLELAEKVERIRELEAEVKSLRTEGARSFQVLNGAVARHRTEADELRTIRGRLEATIVDAVRHVERARGHLIRRGVVMTKAEQTALEGLDLAHEVLSKTVHPVEDSLAGWPAYVMGWQPHTGAPGNSSETPATRRSSGE